jgi:hypothetical protein
MKYIVVAAVVALGLIDPGVAVAQTPTPQRAPTPVPLVASTSISETLHSFVLTLNDVPPGMALAKNQGGWMTNEQAAENGDSPEEDLQRYAREGRLGRWETQYMAQSLRDMLTGIAGIQDWAIGYDTVDGAAMGFSNIGPKSSAVGQVDETLELSAPKLGDETKAYGAKRTQEDMTVYATTLVFRQQDVVAGLIAVSLAGYASFDTVTELGQAMLAKITNYQYPPAD